MCITDKQFGMMEIFRGKEPADTPPVVQQLELFYRARKKLIRLAGQHCRAANLIGLFIPGESPFLDKPADYDNQKMLSYRQTNPALHRATAWLAFV